MQLKRGNSKHKALEIRIPQPADTTGFQRDGVALMRAGPDGVKPRDFPSHAKTGDLFAPVLVGQSGFQKAAVDCIQRYKWRTSVIQITAGFDGSPVRSEVTHFLRFAQGEVRGFTPVSYTHLTLPTSDLV